MHTCVLHKNNQYLEECASVLNEEWPRSKTARIHSLEKSCDKYPVNLVLVNDEDLPVGHSRLSIVVGREKSCFVESVVVKRSLRGKGLGKLLMQETENFARSEGFETMYLSTHDKQDFYQHVGYSFCKPVVSCGIQPSNIPDSFLNKLAGATLDDNLSQQNRLNTKSKDNSCETAFTRSSVTSPVDAPSIPPPPRAPAPPPPPPAVPNPPVANTIGNKSSTDSNSEISKWDPREISWMNKNII
ncbi:N-alpha-acetyltransferase 80-like [Mytilus californianus]|uniref:N-alpha-acetyltransferase 80-like n=1 Tax=Mytilus californianus TaxID=6549 RepID=UPI002245416B|nr:N-alpha-acetyltransferase 80-like [Mytilus californianus]